MRSDIASHNLITAETGLPVLSMELANPRFYHIDVCMCPLEDGHLIYAPEAFDRYGNTVIEAHVPADKRIQVSLEEASHFACNMVNIGNTVIFNQAAPNLIDALRSKGLQVFPLDMSEFIKAGGSCKCLTLRIA
jgi:N-dimethylarginine dimethylaminohydrolase